MSIFVFEIRLESFPPLPSVAFSPIQARHMLFNVLAASQKVLSSACPQGWEILTNGFNSKVERTSKPLIYRWSWEFWMLLFSIWQNRGLARDNGQGYRSYCLLGQKACWPFHTPIATACWARIRVGRFTRVAALQVPHVCEGASQHVHSHSSGSKRWCDVPTASYLTRAKLEYILQCLA